MPAFGMVPQLACCTDEQGAGVLQEQVDTAWPGMK